MVETIQAIERIYDFLNSLTFKEDDRVDGEEDICPIPHELD
jgi:hypothetical protein